MNRYPQLKSFLKDGEAESYEGIKVRYVHGKTAVLTIYKNGVEQERVQLHQLDNKPKLHQLFQDKGFVRKANYQQELEERRVKAQQELQAASKVKENFLKRRRQERRERREQEKHEREVLGKSGTPQFGTILQIYAGLAAVSIVVASYTGMRQRRRRQRQRGGVGASSTATTTTTTTASSSRRNGSITSRV